MLLLLRNKGFQMTSITGTGTGPRASAGVRVLLAAVRAPRPR